ncbi:Sin3-associated polypeptide Sap18 [Blastomyces dermatitidis ER-3]|uniref:Sin3-associated polypeptide Sap18 n=1 Tax=Ajellomyces dermatitidis (strain ER-3 / ATCC MYA-2586) TaxID=559297 RepID=A0ABP2EZU4_AJEDR|nr:Sin3-associated polypeptide Sap18 [Blastomyces dermatitidis ER-3]EEQ89565.1 Sin3-associated polypeptide Sap18 [Blastomyces dermatitidis ER-3]
MAEDKSDAPPKIDRQTTTPFHLKLFYRQHAFHHLSDFPIPPPPSAGTANASNPPPPLPPHLQIYTWPSCSLRELAQLLTSCLPSILPNPAIGTRLSFRLIYPDSRNQGNAGEGRGRYLSRDMGSVIVGPSENKNTGRREKDHPANGAFKLQGDEADKCLQDFRFVIGDYVDCAVLPPLSDGSIAPAVINRGVAGSLTIGGGMRAFGNGPSSSRENGFGRPRGAGTLSRGGGFPPTGPSGVPSGEWRRGERVPEAGGRGFGRGHPRSRGRPY